MTKYLTATLVALVASFSAFAGTFVVPPNATVTGNPDGTVTWSGVALGSVVHFRDVNAPPVEHLVSGPSGSIKLHDVAANGGRLQVRDVNGNWAWLTPQGARFNLVGAHLDCSNHDGCALEVDGTGPKSAPVAHYPGGVYQGYAPATGAVATPVAMVPPPVMVVGSSQSVTGKYRLVPVDAYKPITGKKYSAKPKKPAVAKAAPAKDDCVAGKPIETKDGVVQCIPKLLTRIGDAPEAVGASAPAAPAATAPTAPPAATAPAAPAAAKKQG